MALLAKTLAPDDEIPRSSSREVRIRVATFFQDIYSSRGALPFLAT